MPSAETQIDDLQQRVAVVETKVERLEQQVETVIAGVNDVRTDTTEIISMFKGARLVLLGIVGLATFIGSVVGIVVVFT